MKHAREAPRHIVQYIQHIPLHEIPRDQRQHGVELQFEGPDPDQDAIGRGLMGPVAELDALGDKLEEIGHPFRGAANRDDEPEVEKEAGGDVIAGDGGGGGLVGAAGAAGGEGGVLMVSVCGV